MPTRKPSKPSLLRYRTPPKKSKKPVVFTEDEIAAFNIPSANKDAQTARSRRRKKVADSEDDAPSPNFPDGDERRPLFRHLARPWRRSGAEQARNTCGVCGQHFLLTSKYYAHMKSFHSWAPRSPKHNQPRWDLDDLVPQDQLTKKNALPNSMTIEHKQWAKDAIAKAEELGYNDENPDGPPIPFHIGKVLAAPKNRACDIGPDKFVDVGDYVLYLEDDPKEPKEIWFRNYYGMQCKLPSDMVQIISTPWTIPVNLQQDSPSRGVGLPMATVNESYDAGDGKKFLEHDEVVLRIPASGGKAASLRDVNRWHHTFPAGNADGIIDTTPITDYPWDLFFNQAALDRHLFKIAGASANEMEEYDKLKAKETSKTQIDDDPQPKQVDISDSDLDMHDSNDSNDPNDSDDELESDIAYLHAELTHFVDQLTAMAASVDEEPEYQRFLRSLLGDLRSTLKYIASRDDYALYQLLDHLRQCASNARILLAMWLTPVPLMKHVDELFDHTLPLVRSVLNRFDAPAPISS